MGSLSSPFSWTRHILLLLLTQSSDLSLQYWPFYQQFYRYLFYYVLILLIFFHFRFLNCLFQLVNLTSYQLNRVQNIAKNCEKNSWEIRSSGYSIVGTLATHLIPLKGLLEISLKTLPTKKLKKEFTTGSLAIQGSRER